MPTIKRDELYAALYTDLSGHDESEQNTIRENTLKTLLGNPDDKKLAEIIKVYNVIQQARQNLGKDAMEFCIGLDTIAEYWTSLHDLYVCYLKKLQGKEVNKILIYEAPPPPKDEKINYILAESCKVCEKSENCDDNFQIPPSGPYFDTIKGLNPKSQTIQEILVKQGILFIELCPLPLPMTTDIRKSVWGAWNENIETPPLSVVLLEFALEFALKKGIQISKKPIIAMGTPTATSQSIYYYFEKKKPNLSIKINDTETKVVDFSKLLNINKKYETLEQILPLYASNIISGSNTPNAELLKRIF